MAYQLRLTFDNDSLVDVSELINKSSFEQSKIEYMTDNGMKIVNIELPANDPRTSFLSLALGAHVVRVLKAQRQS